MNGNIFAASGKRMTKTLAAGAVTAVMALGLSMTAATRISFVITMVWWVVMSIRNIRE